MQYCYCQRGMTVSAFISIVGHEKAHYSIQVIQRNQKNQLSTVIVVLKQSAPLSLQFVAQRIRHLGGTCLGLFKLRLVFAVNRGLCKYFKNRCARSDLVAQSSDNMQLFCNCCSQLIPVVVIAVLFSLVSLCGTTVKIEQAVSLFSSSNHIAIYIRCLYLA